MIKKCRHPRADWETCGCVWYLRRRVGGKDAYTALGSDSAAAARAAEQINRQQEVGVREMAERWLAVKASDPNARPNSLHVYRSRTRHIVAYWGDTPVRKIRPEHVSAFVDGMLGAGELRPATVQGIYHALTAILRLAVRQGVLRVIPAPFDGPGIPITPPRRHEVSLHDLSRVIAAMDGTWALVAELILLTGLRWGEAVAIRPDDVGLGMVRVQRTANRYGGVNAPKNTTGRRTVPLTRRGQAILVELSLPVGGDYRRAREDIVKAMKSVGIHEPGMGWHTLRHAHAVLLDQAGVSLRESAARMGHGANFAQTLSYGIGGEHSAVGRLDEIMQQSARPSSATGRVERFPRRPPA